MYTGKCLSTERSGIIGKSRDYNDYSCLCLGIGYMPRRFAFTRTFLSLPIVSVENNQVVSFSCWRPLHLNHVVRKPVLAICKQQRCRSARACAKSNQHLYYSLLRQDNLSSFYIQNFKSLASVCSWAGRFEPYLVRNPEDRFSRDEAYFWIAALDRSYEQLW